MSNSSLVNYTKISPNRSSGRNHSIDTITIHCMAGNLSIEVCGDLFSRTSTQASSNYGVGSDGRIGLYVEEKDRSWATSSSANDNRAVTIEVANDGGAPDWHVSDKALAATIKLVADICKRNGIKKLLWQNNSSLIGQVDKQNMTVHRWFAAKACPGDYLMSKHSYIASEVNKILGSSGSSSTSNEPIVIILKKGSTGSGVIVLQNNLNKAINAKLTVDGDFGAATEKAVKNFQKKYKLTVDGIWGEKSQKKMTDVLKTIKNNGYTTGKYKVLSGTLNIRKGPATSYPVTGVIRDQGIYNIVQIKVNGKSTWGKLKSGKGWICIKSSNITHAKKV